MVVCPEKGKVQQSGAWSEAPKGAAKERGIIRQSPRKKLFLVHSSI